MSLLSPAQLKEKFPWVNTEDVALASYGKAKLLSNTAVTVETAMAVKIVQLCRRKKRKAPE